VNWRGSSKFFTREENKRRVELSFVHVNLNRLRLIEIRDLKGKKLG
jgi:hypothetical protein